MGWHAAILSGRQLHCNGFAISTFEMHSQVDSRGLPVRSPPWIGIALMGRTDYLANLVHEGASNERPAHIMCVPCMNILSPVRYVRLRYEFR
jgi:hypothetical protein